MNKIRSWFRKNKAFLYKSLLFIVTAIAIVYLLPKKGKFKYDYAKGRPWQYENLYAPFDFAILKSEEDLAKEKQQIKEKVIPIFEYDSIVANRAFQKASNLFTTEFDSSTSKKEKKHIYNVLQRILKDIYSKGLHAKSKLYPNDKLIYLKKNNTVTETSYGNIYAKEAVTQVIEKSLKKTDSIHQNKLTAILFKVIEPNVSLNKELTEKSVEQELSKVLTSRGSVKKNARIIAKGEEVDLETFQILKSLQGEFEAKIWSEKDQIWILIGYTVLVSMALLMLFLFLQQYRKSIFENFKTIAFILFNILLMVLLTTTVVKFNSKYVYAVPIVILPLVVKAFSDARLAFFIHVITVLILSFIVYNSEEYMFLQIIAGITSILTSSELYRRANLFISVGKITLIYIVSYIAFHVIQEGSIALLTEPIIIFILCGFATLIVHPLIYGFEKIFGLVSDASLLELSDTNSKLLKQLSNQAPGTFYHSLNVANIAEACANAVDANSLLVRVAALYHDIGKMKNPTYFTENQKGTINRHDSLTPEESAKIIINHVANGVDIARKNNLPERIIEFIKTHHGTSTVYYFYKKAQNSTPNISQSKFQYPGPTPYTKEMAILMMSDSVEAASKSLKQPTAELINNFVEKIIDKQMNEGQFVEADITFKDIQKIKKVMKQKLGNMYHLRVEYPE